METSDILGLLPTLLKVVGDKIVGFDDKIRKRFNHAIENALEPNDKLYINKVQVHLAELIGLIFLVMDEPSSINTITMPNYISRDEFRRLYDQTKKDEYLWRVIQEEWNQYKAKDTNNIVKTTYNLIVDRISSEEDVKQGIEKIIEILEETKINKGSDIVDNGLTFDEYFKEKLLQKRDNHPSFRLMDIEDDLFPDGMITFETEALDSNDQLKSVKDIVAESWNKQDRNHLMIEGKGGIGKTVTLLSLPDKLAPHYVPAVYIPLHELKCETNTIEKYIKSQILDYNDNEVRFGQLMDSVGKPWNKGPRLLMLLDGFNEIPNERRADISLDIEHWSERPGVQIITSSRYDIRQYVALSSSFSKIELQPLKEHKVKAYLKKTGFDVPASPAITNLITTPLLLTLYIRTEKLRIHRKSSLADFRETKNAGLLIWNYLQSELWRYRTQKEEAKSCVLAMEFIAPYIAWTMQQHADFVLNEDDFLDRLDKAYDLLKAHFGNTMELPKHIKTTVKQTSGQLPEYAFIRDLLQEQLSLFNRQERKDANNNLLVEYRLMHQQFRDALAAMHLINTIYLNGNIRPTEWNSTVDHYVMQFVVDLISEDEANRLWEQNRTSPQLESAILNQLELQRRLHNCDFSKLDFSGLDLSNISLYPYRVGNTMLKLPTNADALEKVKISEKSFSPEGHKDFVTAVAVTADGKRIVSGSWDDTIRVWDLETGTCQKTLEGPTDGVNAVAVTADGKRIVSGSWDDTIRVWDMETGACLKTLEGHNNSVTAVAVTADGKCIVNGSGDNTIRVWDLETGACLKTLEGHTESVEVVAVTADGKRIVSGSDDNNVRIWDLETGACLKTLEKHTDSVNAVAVTADGRHIVSGSSDGTIRVWDLETGACLKKLEGHTDSVTAVAVTVDGKRIISGSWDDTIRVWDLETGACLKTLEGHTDSVDAVAVTADCKRIVSGSLDDTIRVWDLETGACLKKLEEHKDWVNAVTADCKRIVSGSLDDTIRVWDMETGACLKTLEGHIDRVTAVAVTADGKRIVSGSWDNTIRVWNLKTGACLETLERHTASVYAVAVTADVERIVSGSWDNTIRVWDLETGACLKTLEGHKGCVYAVAVTPDGKRIVSGSWSWYDTIRVWDLETGACLKILEGQKYSAHAMIVTADGKRIVSGSSDGTVCVWDLDTGACLITLEGHKGFVYAVAVTTDGKRIVSGSGDHTIRVWDLDTGSCLKTLEGHTDSVTSVAVTSDGKRIVSGSWDNTVRIWDLESWECLTTIRIHPLSFVGLDFSKAIFSTPELKETLRQNGAKVDSD